MPSNEKPVVLMIADISGYTEFLLSSPTEVEHSQLIINELIKEIIRHVQIPLKVAKLEGDAVFLFAEKKSDSASWKKTRKEIGKKLILFFNVFRKKIDELADSPGCDCTACKNIGSLKLKIIAHSGKALFHQIHAFNELLGLDVILAHRLLKNSVKKSEYVLMTESGYRDIQFPQKTRVVKGEENIPRIGKIPTLVYFPKK